VPAWLFLPKPQEHPVPTPEPTANTTPAPKIWAIVELFGHARIAGAVSEYSFGGSTFTRVDVPDVTFPEPQYVDGQRTLVQRTIAGHTKLLGANSIYSLAFVDEAAAIAAAHAIKHEPIKPYQLREVLESLTVAERKALLAPQAIEDRDVPY
jgi:hypothetical protein